MNSASHGHWIWPSQSAPWPSDLTQLELRKNAKPPAQRGFEDRIGDDRGKPGAEAELAAQAVADVRVEASGRRHLARHRHVADREDGEDDGREQERGRRPEAVAEAHGERSVEQHRRDRRRARHGQEQNAPKADRVLTKLSVRPPAARRRRCPRPPPRSTSARLPASDQPCCVPSLCFRMTAAINKSPGIPGAPSPSRGPRIAAARSGA